MPNTNTKPNPNATRLLAAVTDAARGMGRRKVQARHYLPERLCRAITAAGLGVEEFRELIIAELQDAAVETVKSYRADLAAGKVSPNSKALAAAIMTDKATMLSGIRASQNLAINVLVNDFGPQSRDEVMARLTGQVFDLPPAKAVTLLPSGDESEQPIPATASAQ